MVLEHTRVCACSSAAKNMGIIKKMQSNRQFPSFPVSETLDRFLLIDCSLEPFIISPPKPGFEADERSIGIRPYSQHRELITMEHDPGLAIRQHDANTLDLIVFKNPGVGDILLIGDTAFNQ